MSVSSEKKLKQALLQFKVSSTDKKRKLDDDTSFDEAKCRKLDFENSAPQNQHPIDKQRNPVNGDSKPTDEAIEVIDLDSDDSGDSCSVNTSHTDAPPSTPETPKCKISDLSKADNNCSTPSNSVGNSAEKVFPKKITPKLSKEERERLKQEKERLKEEREKERKAKEEEKRQKAQAKEEERRQKEEERKAKEEEKRQKAQAKEEERRQKEEERKAKEEEKRQKDEERRLKEEEKRQKEELEKKKKEKTAALFTNFFLKSKTTSTKSQPESAEKVTSTKFMPFEVKENMRLATVQRVILTPAKLRYLDEILSHDSNMNIDSLYLAQLRSKSYVPGHSHNTWPSNAIDDDDEIKDETVVTRKYRCKLLQFRENRRPAYWGTWRKRSKMISGRKPFKLDTTYFEYEIDSDDEWVDEEPGESLGGSEDDMESEDDYEVDNDMFVPHGYLSDEEGQPDEVPEGSPKSHKQKLNILEKQFEAELKEKTSKLKPRVYGCIWISNDVEKNGRDDIENMLLSYRAVWNEDRTPFRVNLQVEKSTSTPSSKSKSTPQTVPIGVLKEFPESLIPDLIKLVHGNKLSGQKLVDEFKLYALSVDATLNLTKSCLLNKIREIAAWIPNLAYWMVNDDIRQQYNLSDLSPADNTWKYISNFESTSKKSQNVAVSVAEKSPSAVPAPMVTTPTTAGHPKKTTSITNFIRVYKASEKDKQPTESTAELEK